MFIGLHVKNLIFMSDLNELLIFATDFRKIFKYKNYHENATSGKRDVPCRETDGETDITKLTVGFAIVQMLLKKGG